MNASFPLPFLNNLDIYLKWWFTVHVTTSTRTADNKCYINSIAVQAINPKHQFFIYCIFPQTWLPKSLPPTVWTAFILLIQKMAKSTEQGQACHYSQSSRLEKPSCVQIITSWWITVPKLNDLNGVFLDTWEIQNISQRASCRRSCLSFESSLLAMAKMVRGLHQAHGHR